ncbi:MAG TPA: S41 family peptidase [Verrucomicrobiae bacterium]|nr:S41 family peptidase [Verrucomicrobiae bacterium]
MMKTIVVTITAGLLLFGAGATSRCRAANTTTSLQPTAEVISVLKSNYVDRDKLNEKVLNEATVTGILEAVGRGAVIVEPESSSTNAATGAMGVKPTLPLARAEVIGTDIGYIRLADVVGGSPAALDAELKKFADAKVTGFVLDLRYADGTNFTAAAAIASRFLNDGQELFTLKSSEKGAQVFRANADTKPVSTAGPDLTSAPLMLLVNAETRGSAEVLAGALRTADRGIVIGSKTAGSAAAWQEAKLSDGRTLRIATAKIVLPQPQDATQIIELFPDGLTPDVAVKIDTKMERDIVLNVQTNETLTASLQPRVKKKGLTEAQLVKVFHGQAVDADLLSPDKEHEDEDEIQNVRDVVLQRAVDILKGIRVLQTWQ